MFLFSIIYSYLFVFDVFKMLLALITEDLHIKQSAPRDTGWFMGFLLQLLGVKRMKI